MKVLKSLLERSKTDQFGLGMIKGMPYFDNEIYCPVSQSKKMVRNF